MLKFLTFISILGLGTAAGAYQLCPDGTYDDSRRHEPAPDTDLSTSRDDDSYDDIYSRTDTYEPPSTWPIPRTEPAKRHSRYNECMRANRHIKPVSARIDLCRHLQSLAEMGVVFR